MLKRTAKMVFSVTYTIVTLITSILLFHLWYLLINSSISYEKLTNSVPMIILMIYIITKTAVLLLVYWKQSEKSKLIIIYKTIFIIDIIFIGAIFLVIILYDILGLFYGHNIVVVLLSTLLTFFFAIPLCATNILLYFACTHRVQENNNEDVFCSNKKSRKRKTIAMIISFMLNVFFDILLQLFTIAFLLTHKHPFNAICIIFIGAINTIMLIGLSGLNLLSYKKSILLIASDLLFVIPYSVFVVVKTNSFVSIIILYAICSLIGSVVSCVILSTKNYSKAITQK